MSQEGQSMEEEEKEEKPRGSSFDCVWVKQEVEENHIEVVMVEEYIKQEESDNGDAEKQKIASGNEEFSSNVNSVVPQKPRKSTPRSRTKQYACDNCSYSSPYKNCLEIHMAVHSDTKPYSCTYCNYSTRYIISLDRHITTKHYESEIANGRNVPVYLCDKCEYSSFSKWNLRSHKRKHNEKTFKCTLCPFSTSYKHNLRKHSKTHEKRKDNTYTCDKCPFETKFEGHIQRHMIKIHNEEIALAYGCENCGFSTKKKWRLKVHVLNNKTEFAVHCTSCDFETFFKCEMKKHKESHIVGVQKNVEAKSTRVPLEMKPVFKCPKCEFQTKSEGLFYKHLAEAHNETTQQDIQLHLCQYCDYSAREVWRIKIHQKKSFYHTSLKCEFCDYSSSFRCNIKKHKSEHCNNYQRIKSFTNKRDNSATGDDACSQVNNQQTESHHQLNNQQNILQEIVSQPVNNPQIYNPLDNMKQIDSQEINNQQLNYDRSLTMSQSMTVNVVVEKLHENDANHEQLNEEPVAVNNNDSIQDSVTVPIPDVCLETEKTDNNEEVTLSYNQTKHGKDNNYLIDPDCVDYRNIQVLGSGKRGREKETPSSFQCHLCDYTSKFKSSVQRHFQRNHTSDDNRPYKCINCSFSTKTKDQISLHNKRSKSASEIVCGDCDFKTKFKCALHDHQKEHYLFRCEFCSYACRTKYDLSKHFSIKHLEFKLQCQYCDYKTGRKESLVYHETIHTGQKPYKCQQCNYSAVRKGTVFSHFRKCHPNKCVYDMPEQWQSNAEPLVLEELRSSRNSLDEILDEARSKHGV